MLVIVDGDGNIAVPLINGKACNESRGYIDLPAAFDSCATLQNNLSAASWQSPIDYSGEWPTVDLAFRQEYCDEDDGASLAITSGDYTNEEEVYLEYGSTSFNVC